MRPGIPPEEYWDFQAKGSFNEAQAMRPGILWIWTPDAFLQAVPSMRPRPCGPGYAADRAERRRLAESFNEAQAMRPGILADSP